MTFTRHIIISDSSSRKSLAVVRGLGKQGIGSITPSSGVFEPSRYSRFSFSPIKKSELFKHLYDLNSTIYGLSQDAGKVLPVLFMEEEDILLHYEHSRETAPQYSFLLPSEEIFKFSMDKLQVSKHAESLGISSIKTLSFNSIDELSSTFSIKDFPSKIVTKPRIGRGSIGVRYFESRDNLFESLKLIEGDLNRFGGLLLQNHIPRSFVSVGVAFLYDRDSQVTNVFAHQRLEQFPISGGPSTRRISIVNDQLVLRSKVILDSMSWVGLAMVEWFFNPENGDAFLVEINPRPWGSISLAILSGQNFPHRYFQLCTGNSLKPNLNFREGEVNRWLIPGDFLRFISQGKINLRAIRCFVRGALKESEEWDLADPLPFFICILQVCLMAFQSKYWRMLLDKLGSTNTFWKV